MLKEKTTGYLLLNVTINTYKCVEVLLSFDFFEYFLTHVRCHLAKSVMQKGHCIFHLMFSVPAGNPAFHIGPYQFYRIQLKNKKCIVMLIQVSAKIQLM